VVCIKNKNTTSFHACFFFYRFQTAGIGSKNSGSSFQVALSTQTVLGNEVVVTASRVAESILKSPVAIEKLDVRTIKETPRQAFMMHWKM
jgi:hypothetical protein